LEDVKRFEKELLAFINRSYPKIGRQILKEKILTDAIERDLKQAVETFKNQFVPTKQVNEKENETKGEK